jgi:ADP-ribosylglycohydrolase
MPPTLYDRFYAVNAAVTVSNSMGDITEGKHYQRIEEMYGRLDQLLPQDKAESIHRRAWGPDQVRPAHHRPPGMTEDGIERHRLMCTAIIEKGGRVTVWDLARVWIRDINPEYFGILLGNQDRIFYDLLKAGMPPTETGRYADWPGFIGTCKMMLPVGLVNACDPRQAALDALDTGRLKDSPHHAFNYALEVCAAVAAGCAEALRPGATVERVIAEALCHLSEEPRSEVEAALAWTGQVEDVWALRPLFAEKYHNRRASNAVEVLSAGLSILRMVAGDTHQAILASVNFGRDCDCISYVSVGLSAALHGLGTTPREWLDIVEEELKTDPYTVSRRSLEDTAQGLYQAMLNELARGKARVAEVEAQIR